MKDRREELIEKIMKKAEKMSDEEFQKLLELIEIL